VNSNAAYTIKIWLTSILITPLAFILLLAVLPSYHIPDMVGLIFIIYLIPFTFILSVVNAIIIGSVLVLISEQHIKRNKCKLLLSISTICTTCLSAMIIQQLKIFDFPDLNRDYILPVAHSLSVVVGLMIFKLRRPTTAAITNR
jgi:hypothetical protein